MPKSEQLTQLYEEYRREFQGEEIVLGDGNPDTRLLLVGEAPGRDEVKLSRPFVGMAGKNLDEFLELLDIPREDIYITNAIKYRLSKVNPQTGRVANRPATKQEIDKNREYIIKEVEIIDPQYIVTLGNVPLKSVTGDHGMNIGAVHGEVKTIEVSGQEYRLFPLYHPASVIYNRSLKEVYIADIKKLKEIMEY